MERPETNSEALSFVDSAMFTDKDMGEYHDVLTSPYGVRRYPIEQKRVRFWLLIGICLGSNDWLASIKTMIEKNGVVSISPSLWEKVVEAHERKIELKAYQTDLQWLLLV